MERSLKTGICCHTFYASMMPLIEKKIPSDVQLRDTKEEINENKRISLIKEA